MLYVHKNALGLGLMRPSTILAILALKLYFGHNYLQSNCNRLINVNLEEVFVKCGQNCNFVEIKADEKTWKRTWIDTIFKHCQKRKKPVEHNTNFLESITKNPIVMDFVSKYTTLNVTRGKINQV